MENGQKDLLDFGRPPLPPWLRLGIAVVVLAALALLTVRLWPGSGPSAARYRAERLLDADVCRVTGTAFDHLDNQALADGARGL